MTCRRRRVDFARANARFRRGQTLALPPTRGCHLMESSPQIKSRPTASGGFKSLFLNRYFYFSSSRVTATAPMAESRTLLPSTSATRPRSI
jgi:hypothetical protein